MRLPRTISALLALCLLVPLGGCLGTGDDATGPVNFTDTGVVETTVFIPAFGIDIKTSGWVKTPTGLYYRTLVSGSDTARVAANGQQVSVNYVGYLVNGQSFDGGVYTFVLGTGNAIAGWHQGIVGMRVGEVRRLLIPASLGYGATGAGPIPPNATLVFDVQVAAIG